LVVTSIGRKGGGLSRGMAVYTQFTNVTAGRIL